MDGGKCILQVRGVRPFFSKKYDITKHKRYKELSVYDKRLAFDIEKYVNHRLVLKKDEPVGKRIDFLIQEINRETNTIGSKSNSLEITNTVIEIKTEIENLREQIQNVE